MRSPSDTRSFPTKQKTSNPVTTSEHCIDLATEVAASNQVLNLITRLLDAYDVSVVDTRDARKTGDIEYDQVIAHRDNTFLFILIKFLRPVRASITHSCNRT